CRLMASIYPGVQFILVKADGTSFPNGDAWKCITCGVPEANRAGVTGDLASYPQAFYDGTRALSGINIIDCGGAELASEACTPNGTHIYPLFLDDGGNVLTGSEKVTYTALNLTNGHWDWFSNLTSTGPLHGGTKITSDGGFHFEVDALYNFFTANGTLVTKVDGFGPWVQPCNDC
ncbi:hypothetical protein INS49_010424, partial [Diaporthe citri]|uniref:uncharacterized protein n=1 Tax=Diaporthe citri TaxID=83186 RepID=UPI001C7FA715